MRRYLASAAVAAALVPLVACGDGDESVSGTTQPPEAGESTAAPPADTATPATAVPAGDLPGEPIDIYPYEGDSLAVVGVAHDDTLNLRSGPGPEFDVVVELSNIETEVIATGQNRQLEDGGAVWGEVTFDGATGWANLQYLAYLGASADVTDEVGPGVGGETMLDLAQAVADARAGDGEPAPEVAVVDEPVVGDLGEVMVDVTGYPDDAQQGERLHILGAPDPSGEAFTLDSVESLTLCRRGVTAEGLCV